MRDDHVGENAELYALGELDSLETARLERHARTCDDCARRIGEAESAMLRMIELDAEPATALPPAPRFVAPSRTPAWIAAVAAAFAIGLIPWGVVTMRQSAPDTSVQSALLEGHFVHAPFVALAAGAPAAKVVYAREGGWLYVLVAAGPDPLEVTVVRGASRTTIATLAAGNAVRSAFARVPGRIDSVELIDRGAAIASVHIAYPAAKER